MKRKKIYKKKNLYENKQTNNKKKSLSVLMAARSRIYALDGLYSSFQCLQHATLNEQMKQLISISSSCHLTACMSKCVKRKLEKARRKKKKNTEQGRNITECLKSVLDRVQASHKPFCSSDNPL